MPLGCRIVFRPTVAAAAGGKSFDLLGVPLAALGMSSGGISTVDRYLPESCRSYCMHRMRLLADQARGNDLARWQRLASVLGREPLIWEYVEHKLRSILTGKRSVGSAGWAWWNSGVLCRGFICVGHCSDATQQSPYVAGEVVEWWPVIWLEVANGSLILPMMCPALAWQDARPWSAHISRVWRCPADWLHDIDGFSNLSSTTQSWSLISSVGDSSLLAGWYFADPYYIVGTGPTGSDDIAILDDVASETTSGANWTEISENTAGTAASSSESTACSSSDAVPRKRRWGK